MCRIKLQDEQNATSEVQSILAEVKATHGKIPSVFRAFALCPDIGLATWERRQRIMFGGSLPFEFKQMIAMRVSSANKCRSAALIHRKNLEKLDVNIYDIQAIVNGEVIDDKLNFIFKFVTIASQDPTLITDEDFDKLRKFGYTDENIVEMLSVVDFITGINKFMLALGLGLND